MVAYIPAELVAQSLNSESSWAVPLAVLVGIPAYLNGYAAIPLVQGMMQLGMAPAVGLAFMLAGSVTSIPAAIAIWSLAKPRLFGLYLLVAVLGSFVFSSLYLNFGSWF